jgi:hypothetical protein
MPPTARCFLSAPHNLSLGMNTEGIFLAEHIFGVAVLNSDGKQVPVRYIGEQHVKEDLGRIPTAQDWLSEIRPQRWMYGQRLAPSQFSGDLADASDGDGRQPPLTDSGSSLLPETACRPSGPTVL